MENNFDIFEPAVQDQEMEIDQDQEMEMEQDSPFDIFEPAEQEMEMEENKNSPEPGNPFGDSQEYIFERAKENMSTTLPGNTPSPLFGRVPLTIGTRDPKMSIDNAPNYIDSLPDPMSVDTVDPRRKIQEGSIISEGSEISQGSEIRNKGLWQQRLKNKKNQDDWLQLINRKNKERINQIKLKREKMAPLIRKTRDLRASDLKLPANFNMPNRGLPPNLPLRKRESPLGPKKDGNFNIVDGKLNIDLDSQNVNIINKRYVLKKKLGEGAFGAVFKAFDTQNNDQVVAIKLQTVRSSSNKKLFGEEIKNLQRISGACSSLVCIMDFGVFSESADLVFIVMDMAVGVSLTDYYREDLKIRQKNYTIEHCLFIALQILKGLHILHINNVAHLDIKPDNIIIDPETMNVKIIDLGLACIQKKCSGGGTPVYMVEGFTGNLLQRMGGDIYAFLISLLELTLRNRKYATSIMFEAERSNVLSKKEVMSAYVEDFIDHSFFLDMFKNFIQTDTMANIPELVEAERTWIILLTQYFSRGFSTFTDSGSTLKKILNVNGPLEE